MTFAAASAAQDEGATTRASYSELACTSPVPSEAASYGLDDSEEEVYNSDQIGVLILEKWNATAEYEILLEPAAYSRRSYAGPHSLQKTARQSQRDTKWTEHAGVWSEVTGNFRH